MDEARRFLRYVTPGLVFAIEVMILFWLLRPDWIKTFPPLLKSDSGIGVILAGLLASGGLGIFFSAIHHAWHWRPNGKMIDHTDLLKSLAEKGILEPSQVAGIRFDSKDARKRAWIFVTALWFQRRDDARIKSAEPRVTALYDLAHSMGANRMAALGAFAFAFIVAASYPKENLPSWPGLAGACAAALGFFCVFQVSYCRTADMAQRVTDQVLSDALN